MDLVEPAGPVDQFIAVDFTQPESIDAAASAVTGPIDGLCNNAGLPPRDGWAQKILRVNFLAPRHLTQRLLPSLGPDASIVNIASRAGQAWRDNINQVKELAKVTSDDALAGFVADQQIDPTRAYNLSKEAMIVWTQAETEPLRARGIRINSLSPAAVSTSILDDFVRAFGDLARTGRAGEAAEIADVAAFLLSPASRWLYGTDTWADGGMAAFATSDALSLDGVRCLDA
jgi:NAD(P)-dependent dehydrogenase (short-subunit alcohol dehydrogenase family)